MNESNAHFHKEKISVKQKMFTHINSYYTFIDWHSYQKQ